MHDIEQRACDYRNIFKDELNVFSAISVPLLKSTSFFAEIQPKSNKVFPLISDHQKYKFCQTFGKSGRSLSNLDAQI